MNDISSAEDCFPTLMAAAGDTNINEELLKGYRAGSMTYKVHLDGYNWMPYFEEKTPQGARREFLSWTDDGGLAALRYNRWKLVFLEQRDHGFEGWSNPFVHLRVQTLFDLRADPFERANYEASDYDHWFIDRLYLLVPAQACVGKWLQSFREFPPRKRPASFSLDRVMETLTTKPQGAD